MVHIKHPVYSALNMRLKIGPADRDMCLAAVILALLVFWLSKSLIAGLLVFAVCYAVAVKLGSKDPNWLVNLGRAGSQKSYYDSAK
jgi:type IV secretory pathway TrbD component